MKNRKKKKGKPFQDIDYTCQKQEEKKQERKYSNKGLSVSQ